MAQNSVTGMRVGAVTIDESPGLRLVIETQSPLQTAAAMPSSRGDLSSTSRPRAAAAVAAETRTLRSH